MECDPDESRQYVESFGMPNGKQDELIQTVWCIMENFVDRAWGEDAVQMAMDKSTSNTSKSALESGPVVELGKDEYRAQNLKRTFNNEKGE